MARCLTLVALGTLVGGGVAHADHDLARITWGRLTNPEHSLVFEMLPEYSFHRLGDPMQDSVALEVEAEYGVTDRLTIEAELGADDASPRSESRPDRVGVGATYRVMDGPTQVSLGGVLAPSFNNKPHIAEAAATALRQWGRWIARAGYVGTLEHSAGGWAMSHEVNLDAYLRFGLNSSIGAGATVDDEGSSSVRGIVGGRINHHLFLGVVMGAGLTGDAPSMSVGLQLHVYFGPYYSAGLE